MSHPPWPLLALPNSHRHMGTKLLLSGWLVSLHSQNKNHFTFVSGEVLGRKDIFDLLSTALRDNFVFTCGCAERVIQNRAWIPRISRKEDLIVLSFCYLRIVKIINLLTFWCIFISEISECLMFNTIWNLSNQELHKRLW